MFNTVLLDDEPKNDTFEEDDWEIISKHEKQEHNGARRKWYKLWRR